MIESHSQRIIRWANELKKDPQKYLDMFDRVQLELGASRAYDYVIEKMQSEKSEASATKNIDEQTEQLRERLLQEIRESKEEIEKLKEAS